MGQAEDKVASSQYCQRCDSFGAKETVSGVRQNMAEMLRAISDDFWDALVWDQMMNMLLLATACCQGNRNNKGWNWGVMIILGKYGLQLVEFTDILAINISE